MDLKQEAEKKQRRKLYRIGMVSACMHLELVVSLDALRKMSMHECARGEV